MAQNMGTYIVSSVPVGILVSYNPSRGKSLYIREKNYDGTQDPERRSVKS